MQHLALLAPLRSFVVSKASKFLSWSFCGLKYAARHPIKTIFNLIKLWLCLMALTFFTTVVMAEPIQPDMSDLIAPKHEPSLVCVINNFSVRGCGDTATEAIAEACDKSLGLYEPNTTNRIPNDPYCSGDSIYVTGVFTPEFGGSPYTEEHQLRSSFLPDDDKYTCPPDNSPNYYISVPSPSNPDSIMCAKELINNCPDPSASDTPVFGGGFSQQICYQNPDGTQCKINTNQNGDYHLPAQYSNQEPVACGDDPSDEDKFCYVHGSDGTYSISCPTTSISIDTTGIQKNADQLLVNHQRISEIEASYISQQEINDLVQSGQLKGEKGEQGEKGDKGDKGDQGEQGIQGARGAQGQQGVQGEKGEKGDKGDQGEKGDKGDAGADGQKGEKGEKGDKGDQGEQGIQGIRGINGTDGEDGEGCSIVSTPDGAAVTCGENTSELSNGNCTTEALSNGDTKVTCPDGTESTINGVDEDGIIGALDKQLNELQKQTDELKAQSESLEDIGTYDGEKPVIDYETKPDGYTEIAEFDWEAKNFGTVLEEHNQAMRQLPIVSSIENFFTTSFGGSCPTWSETVTVLDASFTVTIDQFCSPAVQNILPMIRAILMLVAGFFAWRIAIE